MSFIDTVAAGFGVFSKYPLDPPEESSPLDSLDEAIE